jgi:mannose-6-phosphate isomerase-like protein (cupin superfamily)
MQKINLAQMLARFDDYWNPRIVGRLNGQHVKLVKFQGEFVWHQHADEDELFLVVRGSFCLDYRDPAGIERSIDVGEGELIVVPRGTEHRPRAADEVHVLLFEPAGTVNTGNIRNERTVEHPVDLLAP